MIVYKYQNQEGSIASIINNCVLLKCPLDYNDPFDGLYIVNEKEREKAYKLFLNYQIFKCTENYFFAPSVQGVLEGSQNLVQLSRENNELPNFGFVDRFDVIDYQPIKMEDIPNLLSPQYALERTIE